MSSITLAPIQWAALNDIDDVEPLNDGDAACLSDIRDVLRTHGMIDRFGVALLHSHFPLADDEVMLDDTDKESRTLTLRPAKVEDASRGNVGTIWALKDGLAETMYWCKTYCKQGGGIFFGHATRHRKVKD